MREQEAVRRLAQLIEEASGNTIPPGHLPFLAEAAARRARARRLPDAGAYVGALERGALEDEWRSLLPLITVKESYFFRTPQQFDAIAALVLPELVRARMACRRLRVWSAGCAHGEEPATLAIVLSECEALDRWEWSIEATDVDEDALAAARRGRYGERAVAHVPPALLSRHFVRHEDGFEFSPRLRERIRYRAMNLVHEPFPVPAEPHDLILLRNVLIYFRQESQRRVIAGIARSLARDGFLFLGPSETLWQLSEELEPMDLGDCFCYRHRSPAQPGKRHEARGEREMPPARQERRANATTAEVARETTPRATNTGSAGAAATPGSPKPRSAGRGAQVTATAKPAVEAGGTSPEPGLGGTAERLAAAAGHLAANRLAEATELVEEAVRTDPSDAGAHALEGLLHDLSARGQLALASYRAALFLDPALFQVRLLLADSLRRLGWEERARREYREVLATLAGGRPRELAILAALPLPTREQAERRSRQALRRG